MPGLAGFVSWQLPAAANHAGCLAIEKGWLILVRGQIVELLFVNDDDSVNDTTSEGKRSADRREQDAECRQPADAGVKAVGTGNNPYRGSDQPARRAPPGESGSGPG